MANIKIILLLCFIGSVHFINESEAAAPGSGLAYLSRFFFNLGRAFLPPQLCANSDPLTGFEIDPAADQIVTPHFTEDDFFIPTIPPAEPTDTPVDGETTEEATTVA